MLHGTHSRALEFMPARPYRPPCNAQHQACEVANQLNIHVQRLSCAVRAAWDAAARRQAQRPAWHLPRGHDQHQSSTLASSAPAVQRCSRLAVDITMVLQWAARGSGLARQKVVRPRAGPNLEFCILALKRGADLWTSSNPTPVGRALTFSFLPTSLPWQSGPALEARLCLTPLSDKNGHPCLAGLMPATAGLLPARFPTMGHRLNAAAAAQQAFFLLQ